MRMHRYRQQRTVTSPRVNLTPLIDTALTLLVIFMVTTPLIQNGIKVELPKGSVNEIELAQQPQEWTVSIDARGLYYLNKQSLTHAQLLQQLRNASEQHGLKAVMIRADAGVNFGVVAELVEAIKKIGKIEYVAFATEKNHA